MNRLTQLIKSVEVHIFLLLPFMLILNTGSISAQKKDDRIYKVRLAAFRGSVDMSRYTSLSRYGALSFEPADNGYTRVYLGNYIGRATAQRILNAVKSRFKTAYIILDQNLYSEFTAEDVLYYTFQISAVKNLDARKILDQLDPVNAQALHIHYHNGFYRYSLGIYDRDILPQTEDNYRALAFSLGFTEGFAKQIPR